LIILHSASYLSTNGFGNFFFLLGFLVGQPNVGKEIHNNISRKAEGLKLEKDKGYGGLGPVPIAIGINRDGSAADSEEAWCSRYVGMAP